MVSFSLDKTIQPFRAMIRKHGLPWPHVFLADWKDQITKSYGVRVIPFIILIGPDGKVLATHLRKEGIRKAVVEHGLAPSVRFE